MKNLFLKDFETSEEKRFKQIRSNLSLVTCHYYNTELSNRQFHSEFE
jgi:hypothetical protein